MAKPTLQTPVAVIPLFAVYRADKYESTYPLSHHTTKAGAYRAMRRHILEQWNDWMDAYVNEWRVMVMEDGTRVSKRDHRWYGPLYQVRFFVAPDDLKVYE